MLANAGESLIDHGHATSMTGLAVRGENVGHVPIDDDTEQFPVQPDTLTGYVAVGISVDFLKIWRRSSCSMMTRDHMLDYTKGVEAGAVYDPMKQLLPAFNLGEITIR